MADIKHTVKGAISAMDEWQRRHRTPGVTYAVIKKFGDDDANLLVVSLGWYGFTAIYPLLLVVITVFAYIGVGALGNGIVHTLHQFPVIGSQFKPGRGGTQMHGSVLGLIIGAVGLVYGAQGVTQVAEKAMARVWNVPQTRTPGFMPRLARSLIGLATIGGAFLINAFLAPIATGHGIPLYARVLITAGMLAINCGLYLIAFKVLTPAEVTWRQLAPGSLLAAVAFTILITLGAGLVQHQLRHSSATYGAFAAVLGLVTFLLLLSKITIYAAELNPVLNRRLWPRALPTCSPAQADDEHLQALVHEQRRRPDQSIGVRFGAPEDDVEDTGRIDGGRQSEGAGRRGHAN